jgi:hypothetical protein
VNLDWQRIALNIRRAGVSPTAQAKRIGMDPSTVLRYSRGELTLPPRFDRALDWLDLHAQLCPDKHKLEALRK